jgi:hypothetical protein
MKTECKENAGQDSAKSSSVGNFLFYLGLGFLFTHEMDSMSNHEWRVLPLLNALPDKAGEVAFLMAHVPLFALVMVFVASTNSGTRLLARKIACGFMIIHGVLHIAFTGHSAYEFSSLTSELLIFGAALCGLSYFIVRLLTRNFDVP